MESKAQIKTISIIIISLIILTFFLFSFNNFGAGKSFINCKETSTSKECVNSLNGKTLEIYETRYYDGNSWKPVNMTIKKSSKLNVDYEIETSIYKVQIDGKNKKEIKLSINGEDFIIKLKSDILEINDNKVLFDISDSKINGTLQYEFLPNKINKLIIIYDVKESDKKLKTNFIFEENYIYPKSGKEFKIDESLVFWDTDEKYSSKIIKTSTKTKIEINKDLFNSLTFPIYIDPSLEVTSGTTILGGTHTYDSVIVHEGGTLQVNESIGWLNLSAYSIIINGQINGFGKSNYSDGNSGGVGGSGSSSCTNGNGGSGGSGAGQVGSETSRTDLSQGLGAGNGGRGGYGYSGNIGWSAGASGGRGGAGLRLYGRTISINGTINMSSVSGGAGGHGGGGDGTFAGSGGGGGGGGGGSAGTILIDGLIVNISNSNFRVIGGSAGGGGAGGSSSGSCGTAPSGTGGSGGAGGRIKIFSYNLYNESFVNNLGTGGTIYYEVTAGTQYNTVPILTANTTKPNTVYTNTNWLINLTATDEEESYINSYVQFYVNDVKSDGEITFNMTNNTNHQVASLLNGNFSEGDVLIAEVWLSDNMLNSTKENLTSTVQNSLTIELNKPTNFSTQPSLTEFNCSVSTGINNLVNITLNIWNSTGDLYNQTTTIVTGTYNESIISIEFTYDDTFIWNCFAYNDIVESNWADSNHTFYTSINSPAINLDAPSDNIWLNYKNNIYFNFTATDLNGLSECQLFGNWSGWHKNYTWINPTNATQNYTILNLSDGIYVWNIWCNDTLGNGEFSISNYTLSIDTIYPIVSNISITPTAGSQTITFDHDVSDTNLDSCKYSIFNSTGQIDGLNENVSVTCGASGTSATVSDYGTYNLTIYAIDLAGNENSTTKSFTTSASSSTPPGGGGITIISGISSIEAINFSITTLNFENRIDISLAKNSKKPRQKDFYISNSGIEPINIEVICDTQNVNESSKEIDICKYVTFSQTNFTVSPNAEERSKGSFELLTPENSSFGDVYYFNLLGIRKVGEETRYSKLSVSSRVSLLATLFYKWSALPSSDEEKPIIFPRAIVSLIGSFLLFLGVFFIFKKNEMVLTGFFIGTILFVLSYLGSVLIF